MTLQLINVHIGGVKTGTGDQQLHTILGSCIGIALLWPKRGTYGLAHCLLPKAPAGVIEEMNTEHQAKRRKGTQDQGDKHNGGKYVDQAIESLTRLMSITDYRDIRAVVAGGANMTQPNHVTPEKLVGYQNACSALEGLRLRKIIVVHEDTGGHVGRKMSISCDSGIFDVTAIPRIAA